MSDRVAPAERLRCWKAVFGSPDARTVLDDLARYCGANATTARMDKDGRCDPLATLTAEGRRQVWLFVQQRISEQPRPEQEIA